MNDKMLSYQRWYIIFQMIWNLCSAFHVIDLAWYYFSSIARNILTKLCDKRKKKKKIKKKKKKRNRRNGENFSAFFRVFPRFSAIFILSGRRSFRNTSNAADLCFTQNTGKPVLIKLYMSSVEQIQSHWFI